MLLQRAAAYWLKQMRLRSQNFVRAYETPAMSYNLFLPHSSSLKLSQFSRNGYDYRINYQHPCIWIVIAGHAVILGINANPVLAKESSLESSSENYTEQSDAIGLHKVEDGSVISNLHTSKWRVFTDHARDMFLKGKLEEAEKFFIHALEEAKEGFGERDPHVASACNNLAEMYRVTKAFGKAEPLYLEAINILKESYGPEDIRVAAAYHNLGQFYLAQRQMEEARIYYERALKIKALVLGLNHMDSADTMYHLGTVLYLQGKLKDSEALIQDSIRILEESGQGESTLCIRRLRYLAQMYMKSNRLLEAENVQRKVLHVMELSKGWNSMDTINVAEGLALTLKSAGSLKEAQELLERCLDSRKILLPPDHVQIGANMLHIARVLMLRSSQLKGTNTTEAIHELDKAKVFLMKSFSKGVGCPTFALLYAFFIHDSIARVALDKTFKYKGKKKNLGAGETRMDCRTALLILLQSLEAQAVLESSKKELQDLKESSPFDVEAENSLLQCIAAFKEFGGANGSISEAPEIKAAYLSCLKHLWCLIGDTRKAGQSARPNMQDLKDEIKQLEVELAPHKKRQN